MEMFPAIYYFTLKYMYCKILREIINILNTHTLLYNIMSFIVLTARTFFFNSQLLV